MLPFLLLLLLLLLLYYATVSEPCVQSGGMKRETWRGERPKPRGKKKLNGGWEMEKRREREEKKWKKFTIP